MKVILSQNLDNLGKAGDVVTVKDGYARNYLIPNGLVKEYSKHNLKWFEDRKEIESKRRQKYINDCKEMSDKIAKLSCTIPVKVDDEGKCYGSVSVPEVHKALLQEGIEIDKAKIDLTENIRELGVYHIPINLTPDIATSLKVWVVKE